MASQPNTDGKKQILPQSFHIGDEEGFVPDKDIFSYEPFGETLGK